MRNLLKIQIRLILPLTALIYIVSFATIFFIFPEVAWALPILAGLGTFVGNHRLRRSEWYLGLPWSRRKIAAQIAGESIAIAVLNFLMTCTGFFIFKEHAFKAEGAERLFFYGASLGAAVGAFLSIVQALSGKPIRRKSAEDLMPGRRAIFIFLSTLVVWFLLRQIWTLSQPERC